MDGWKIDWLIDWSWNEITMIKKRVFVGNRRVKRREEFAMGCWVEKAKEANEGWVRKIVRALFIVHYSPMNRPLYSPFHLFIHSLSILSPHPSHTHNKSQPIHPSIQHSVCSTNNHLFLANTNFTMLHVVALKQNQEIRNYSLDNSSCATHSHQSHPSLQNDRISAQN